MLKSCCLRCFNNTETCVTSVFSSFLVLVSLSLPPVSGVSRRCGGKVKRCLYVMKMSQKTACFFLVLEKTSCYVASYTSLSHGCLMLPAGCVRCNGIAVGACFVCECGATDFPLPRIGYPNGAQRVSRCKTPARPVAGASCEMRMKWVY